MTLDQDVLVLQYIRNHFHAGQDLKREKRPRVVPQSRPSKSSKEKSSAFSRRGVVVREHESGSMRRSSSTSTSTSNSSISSSSSSSSGG